MAIRSILTYIFIFSAVHISNAQDPWINEIHYDNDGSDITEGIEIAGPAYTSLNCYDLVFYNGNDGNPYLTVDLSGVLPDESCGFGTLWFSIPGIQNGSPDGVALYFDASNSGCTGTDYLVQFISYEGSFTASNSGPNVIDGQISTDIGVSEGGSSTIGHSLQLNGNGDSYADFTWSSSAVHTNGSLNTNQTISPCTIPSYSCIWTENFSTQTDGTQNDPGGKWTTNANNCDADGAPGSVDNNYWGVQNGEFRINDIEGLTCPCGLGGDNDNLFITQSIDISGYTQISLSITLRAFDEGGGGFECDGLCNSEDRLTAQYEVDGNGWVTFAEMCGVNANYNALECIDVPNGNLLQIRVLAGNQSNDENYYFDNINVCEAVCAVVLPVELISFKGEFNASQLSNHLTWETNSERNNDYFIIEKLDGNMDWNQITRVSGSGTTSIPQQYNFDDTHPNQGLNYYRISQVDYDGQRSTHNTMAIQSNLEGFKMYPNPTSDRITVECSVDLIDQEISVINSLGRVVYRSRTASNSFLINLNESGIASGVYTVVMGNYTERLIIK